MAIAFERPARRTPRDSVGVRRWVAYACVVVVLVRLIYVWQPLRSDEGGYLLAARHWRTGGEFLYGDYHVDRPPLLMSIYRLAALSDWDPMIRALSIPFAVVAVAALARAGYLLAGSRGACWSAAVAAALVTSPALAADQADGELFALPLVAAGVALTLEAWRARGCRRAFWYAVAAGVCAAAAPLVKQSFLDGLVFVLALVTADSALRRRVLPGRARVVAVGAGLGAVVPLLAVLTWARSAGVDGTSLWAELVAFRAEAFAVIWQDSIHRPLTRGVRLVALAIVSGMVPLAWAWRRAMPTSPEHWAVSCTLVFAVAALLAGGSYWPHYLLQLVPMLALAAGITAASDSVAGATMRWAARVTVLSAAVAAVLTTVVYAAVPGVWSLQRTGTWLAESSHPSDTAVVVYGHPSVLEAADLRSPYPYLWSLPVRTLDPGLARLRATLAGPEAPTWIVQTSALNSWNIDEGDQLRSVIKARYDVAATICGHAVWLRSDLTRPAAAPPAC